MAKKRKNKSQSNSVPLKGLEERYSDFKKIGSGGMATVYRAKDKQLDRDVAIKVIKPEKSTSEIFQKRFEREAKVVARLQHPNIVQVYDYQTTDKGSYYVMPLIDGETLADILEQGHIHSGQIKQAVKAILSALEYAHREGIIHRDIKPENVFLDKQGRFYLGDFGILTFSAAGEGRSTLTEDGNFQGTPAYASPEQIEGHPLSPASDIYAAGVLFYQLLSGELPFDGNLNQIISGHLNRDLPAIDTSRLDESLRAMVPVVERMLRKDPASRYQSCQEALNALETKWAGSSDTKSGEPLELPEGTPEMVQQYRRVKQQLEENQRLLDQLKGRKATTSRKLYVQLRDRYREAIENLKEQQKRLQFELEARRTETDLKLQSILAAAAVAAEGSETEIREKQLTQELHTIESELEPASLSAGKLAFRTVWMMISTALVGALLIVGYIGYAAAANELGTVTEAGALLLAKPEVTANRIGRVRKGVLLRVSDSFNSEQTNSGVVLRKTYARTALRGGSYWTVPRGATVQMGGVQGGMRLIRFKKQQQTGYVQLNAVRHNNWVRVATPDGHSGWMLASSVKLRDAGFFQNAAAQVRWMLGDRGRTFPQGTVVASKGNDEGGIFGNLPGIEGLTVKKQAGGQYRINGMFVLDFNGVLSIEKALQRRIQRAETLRQTALAGRLKKMRQSFIAGDFKDANTLVKTVHLSGDFNSWDPTGVPMVTFSTQNYQGYQGKIETKLIHQSNRYAFAVKLQQGKGQPVQLWVQDPTATNRSGNASSQFGTPKKPEWRVSVSLPNLVQHSSAKPGYEGFMAFDKDPKTSWISGKQDGGIGQMLELKFAGRQRVRELVVTHPGENLYGYNRIAGLEVHFSDGKKTELKLRDGESAPQRFIFKKPHWVKWVKLKVTGVYPGLDADSIAVGELSLTK